MKASARLKQVSAAILPAVPWASRPRSQDSFDAPVYATVPWTYVVTIAHPGPLI